VTRGYPIKEQRWRAYHWNRWDRLTPRERTNYEKKVEDHDNALVMAHIRGTKQSRRCAHIKYGA